MSRYLIEDVKRGENNKGIAYDIIGGPTCTCIKFKRDYGSSRWLELDDIDGIPNFYLAETDLFSYHVNISTDDASEIKRFNEDFITEFEGIALSDNYWDLCEQFNGDKKNNPVTLLLRYMLLVASCSESELSKIIDLGIGHFVDEIDIPLSEIEQEYLEDIGLNLNLS